MTYNMLHAPGDRLESLLAVVRAQDPDIVACQELNDVRGYVDLCCGLGMEGVLARANRAEVAEAAESARVARSEPQLEHIALFSKHPIVSHEVHPGDPRVMFRPVLEARVAVPNLGFVDFLSVHLRAFAGPPNAQYKLREAGILAGLIRRAGRSERLCVLGDFNAWMNDVRGGDLERQGVSG